MKGVPSSSITYYAEQNGLTLNELYLKMYEGESVVYDLVAVRPKFDMRKDMTIISKQKFNREIHFNYNGQEIL